MWSRSGRQVRRGTARTRMHHCLALSRPPTHPSHTSHPVLRYLCCFCLCVCVYLCFDLQVDLNVFSVSPLVVDLCGLTRCSHKMIHSVLGNRQLKNEKTHCLNSKLKILKMIRTVFVVWFAGSKQNVLCFFTAGINIHFRWR